MTSCVSTTTNYKPLFVALINTTYQGIFDNANK